MSTQINHESRAHAVLSASGASRWLACTPSAILESSYPESSSEYAEEGTLAHELAELKLRSKIDLCNKVRSTPEQTKQRRAEIDRIQASKYYSKEMEELTSEYVDYCISEWQILKRVDPSAAILVETRLDFSHIAPDGFGTGDCLIIGDKLLISIDLKYGQGKTVRAFDNPQLKLYGEGARNVLDGLFEINRVRLTIYQPRKDNISSHELSVNDLVDWAQNYVKPRADTAARGEGELVTGDHCGFCKHRVRCKALLVEAQELFESAGSTPVAHSTDEELLEVYAKQSRIESYLSAVAAHLLAEAMAGKKLEGYKLVEGRSVRQITDEQRAEQILKEQGFGIEDVYNMKMKGLGDLEKLVGKKTFGDVMADVIEKKPGKLTLVPESDKRSAVDPIEVAKNLFADSDGI